MKKTKSLIASLAAIVVCFAMLIGTTFAWFTDSVINTNTIIKSGNIDVELWHASNNETEYEEVKGSTKLFVGLNDDQRILWEPGASATENFQIKNAGSLALKYELRIKAVAKTFTESGKSLTDILTLTIIGDNNVNNTAVFGDGYVIAGELLAGDVENYTATIDWFGTENDNDYNVKEGLELILGIELVATQLSYEVDGTGPDYDGGENGAQFPNVSTYVSVGEGTGEVVLATKGENSVSATLPVAMVDALPETITSVAVAHTEPIVDLDNKTIVFEAIKLVDQKGHVIELKELGVDAEVTITLPAQPEFAGLPMDIYHDGEKVDTVTADENGVITYQTTHFSEVRVEPSFAAGSVFKGVNPVEMKPELAEENSEYVSIKYMQDGEECYVIAERLATRVVFAGEMTIEQNDNVIVEKNASGKMYSIMSGLKSVKNLAGEEKTTVYLFPGTYNEATTINVYSSMDIIGLGNKEDIVVTKVACHSTTSTKPSNRHLFNISGTKADYIQVTIRNMTLDAMAHNTYQGTFLGKPREMTDDNYAVQCIRKAKVKCYDLVVKDNTYGFCVNAKNINTADNTYNNAYLYVENCETSGSAVIDSSSSKYDASKGTTDTNYYFYYNNILAGPNKTAYTTTKDTTTSSLETSGAIKNVVMAADDWDWEN